VATLVPIASSAPPVPDGIDGPNIERWREIWSSAPWLSVTLDSEAVREYLECIVERDEMRGSITELGMVQEEPIVSTRGQVVGHRQVHHPLLAHLRRLEARIDQARERLGLSPGSRARLGLVEIELRERAGRLTNPKTAWRKPEERTK
jgi:P27 family predicted phage terminase small subunit